MNHHHLTRADVLGLSSLGAAWSLQDVSTAVSILAGLLAAAVYAWQLYDRYRGKH